MLEKLRSAPKTKFMREGSAKEPFMLQGLCRCSACGATLTRAVGHGSLQCYSYAHGKCKISHSISIRKINEMVIDLFELIVRDNSVKIQIDRRPEKPKENISALIEKEKKKLARIKDAYENGIYDLEEFRESREKVLSHIEALKSKIVVIVPDPRRDREIIVRRLITLLPSLKSPAVPEEEKNSLIKSVVEQIVFNRSKCDIDIFFHI